MIALTSLLATAQQPSSLSKIIGHPTILMLLMFVVLWVLFIRPQQKQRRELAAKQNALKKGDEVITIGGLHGTVNAVSESTVSIKVAENTFVKFDKIAIATIKTKAS